MNNTTQTIYLIIFIVAFMGLSALLGQSFLPYNSSDIYIAINEVRVNAGLQPLQYSTKLETISYNRFITISTNQALEHGDNWSFQAKTSFTGWKAVGENLAQGQATIDELINDWINSPTHKANIYNPNYNTTSIYVGKGKIKGEDKIIIVQTFLQNF